MLAELKVAFLRRDSRDQVMLLLLLAALSMFLLYHLLVLPLNGYINSQQVQLAGLQASHGRVKNLAAQVIQGQASNVRPAASNSLAQQVDQALRQSGLSMQGLQSGADGEVRLRLQEVEYSRLLQWLYSMEVELGVQVISLSMVASQEEGRVVANIVLRKGG